jgi:hypothetical protein
VGSWTSFGGGARSVERLTANLGERSGTSSISWRSSCGRALTRYSGTVEAAMNAAREANVPPDAVARILVAGQNRTGIQGSRRPANLAEAIHSLSYYVAAAVADKDFTWAHASETKYSDPRIVKLMDLVDVDPAPPPVKYLWSWGGTVTIVTTDGKRFTSTVDAPRGSGPRGIAWSDVEAKYRALMPESKLPARRIDDALSLIHGLERVKNVSELTPAACARTLIDAYETDRHRRGLVPHRRRDRHRANRPDALD